MAPNWKIYAYLRKCGYSERHIRIAFQILHRENRGRTIPADRWKAISSSCDHWIAEEAVACCARAGLYNRIGYSAIFDEWQSLAIRE